MRIPWYLVFVLLPGLCAWGKVRLRPRSHGAAACGYSQPRNRQKNAESRELGIAYYRTGKLIDAEHAFAAAMAEDPADLESIQMRGLTLYRLGRPGGRHSFS